MVLHSSVGFSVQQFRRVQCSSVRAKGGKVRVSIVLREQLSLLRVQHSSVSVAFPYITNIFISLAIFLHYVPLKICDKANLNALALKKLIDVAIVSLQIPPFCHFEAMKRQNSVTLYIFQAMK
jgi:hypothetical protein